jgi:predicted AlkP superfamily phosphohydrolase/phosphomutase
MFEFTTLRPGTYLRRPVTLLDWRQPPLWELLNRCGLSVGVFNVPVTFPAQPVDGYMVSGEMGTPYVDRRMLFPQDIRHTLREQLRRYELEPISGNGTRHVRKLTRQIAARNAAALTLAEDMPTDVVIIVVNYVDHAQHFFWDERHEGLDGSSETSNPVLGAYAAADRLLRSLQEPAGDECTTIVLSDHGAGPVRGYLDVDRMLASLGYFSLPRTGWSDAPAMYARRVAHLLRPIASRAMKRAPSGLKDLARRASTAVSVDYSSSAIFSVGDCCSLRVNLRGRESAGHVPAAELARFCLDARRVLHRIEGLDDEPLFEVYLNSEVYRGPYIGLGPDLIAMAQQYSVQTVSATPARRHWLVSRAEGRALGLAHCVRSGSHRREGIVAAVGPGVQPGHVPDAAPLADVAPTVMSLLGCPVPGHVDGQAMPWVQAGRPHRGTHRPGPQHLPSPQESEPYAPPEEAVVTARLQGLGYRA